MKRLSDVNVLLTLASDRYRLVTLDTAFGQFKGLDWEGPL